MNDEENAIFMLFNIHMMAMYLVASPSFGDSVRPCIMDFK